MKLKSISIILIMALIALGGCKSSESIDEQVTDKIPKVQATKVMNLRPEKEIILPGDLKAWEETQMYAKVKGFVKEVKSDRGKWVNKGEVLAILEAPEINAARDEAKSKLYEAYANLEEDKALFLASKAAFIRLLETSKTQGAVSPFELEQAKSKMMTDSSRVQSRNENIYSAQSYLKAKNELVEYLTIRAPFDGVISERNISPGTLVGPDDAGKSKPIYILVNSKRLRLTVAIPEVYSSELIPNSTVSFKVTAYPEKKFTAKLARISENLQEGIRSMMAEFDVENTTLLLKAGTFTDVHIPIQRTSKTLFVPKKAVVNSQERTFVIKISDNLTEWIDVKTGNPMDTTIEVFGELKEGDTIVKKASEELKQGQKVQVLFQ